MTPRVDSRMVGAISFTGLVVVMAVAVAVPLLLGLVRRAHVTAAAVELAAGVAIGPQGLGWVDLDAPVVVLAALGLAFLLFLAGAEVDLAHLRGATARLALLAFAGSVALAMAVGLGLQVAGLVAGGAFVALILCGTHLGAVVGTLGDAGRLHDDTGRLALTGAAIANVATVTLLGLAFGGMADEAGARGLLLAAFVVTAALVVLGVCGLERWMRLGDLLVRLQDSTAQIRVRAAVLLVVALIALGGSLGVEVVLGAFAAGAVLSLVDRDAARTHPLLHVKLEAIGHGFLIPVFLVTAGMRLDVDALVADASSIVLAPILLAALLLVRGLPALVLYRRPLGVRGAGAVALLQATSLPFVVAASQIAVDLDAIGPATGAALVVAGLVSVAVLPEAAKSLLRADAVAPAGARPT